MPVVLDTVEGEPIEAGRGVTPEDGTAECLHIALINNMPDPALEDTETQFADLLHASSGDLRVRLKLFSLPGIPRGERGQERLVRFYFDIRDLWKSRFDAIIVTGTEPHCPELHQEPYWPALKEVLDWAEQHTASAVLSCLAAHAGVLHSDGIGRHRLADKQFGVFQSRKAGDHALMNGARSLLRFPHSRWNEVRPSELVACGYSVLTRSDEAGVDLFVKQKRKSLFVHFQGHPEYSELSLLKEYRRDVKRFLMQQRDTYPSMPEGYFGPKAAGVLHAFRERALAGGSPDLMAGFPDTLVAGTVKNTWRSTGTCVYRRWLQYVASRRGETLAFAAIAQNGRGAYRPGTLIPADV